ncbi:MAG: T9SS type A sorting domain-containing protein, partial [Cyclobacteriaceae bacterium]
GPYSASSPNVGSIFRINADGSNFTVLHAFYDSSESNFPQGSLILYENKLLGFTSDALFSYDLETSTFNRLVNGDISGSLLVVNVDDTTPDIHVMVPVNGAINQKTGLYLTTNAIPEATTYTIQMSSDAAFTHVKEKTGDRTLWFDSLQYNTVYFTRTKTNLREDYGRITSFTTAAPEFFSYVTSPANGAEHMPLSLIITSNLVSMADTYTIELNSDPNFGESTALVQTGGRSISFNNLALSTTYFTRVKTNLSPNWGEMRVFTTDDALSLSYIISPGNNASNVSWLPLIRVNTIPEATFYRIQLCASDDFTSSQVFEKSMPSPSINFSDLQFNTRYYARATTDLTPQGWGPTRFFTTGNPVSFAYVESPLNNFTGANTTLNIASRSVPSAGSYTIQLSESSDFAWVAFEVTGPTRMLPFSGLKYNTTYFSRVQTDLTKEFGQVKSFTTRKAETLAFVTAPSNHAVNVNNVSIYITSNFVPGAQAYSIQLSETSDFSKVAFEVTGSNRTLLFGGLKFSTTYFSRVRTDLAPEFGELKSFTTRTAESIAYVVSPSHNSEYINTRLNIYSNYVLGASQYTIQLSESSDFAQVAFEVSGSTRMLSFSGLKYNTTYFSRVNTDLTAEFGQVRSFSTCSAESLAYVTTPSNHAVDVNNNSIFITSNSVPGAQAYTIQLSETSDFSTVAFERTGFNRTLLFGGLKYSTTYYSRVSTDLELEFGEQKSFTTRTAESIAYIVSPENNSVNVGTSLYIYSNSIPGSTEYTIQLSQQPDFSIIDFEVKGHTRALAFMGLTEGTIYYNRVQSNLSANFGQVRSFKTRGVAPPARIASNIIKSDEKSAEVNEFVVSVYPNPFREKLILFIESLDQQAEILLMDLNGRNIHQSIEKTNRIIEVEKEFSPGAYLLSIKTDHYSKIIRVVRVE